MSTRFFSAEEKIMTLDGEDIELMRWGDLDKNVLEVSCQKIRDELIKFLT